MTLQLNGTSGLTFNDGSLQPSAASGKNLIINGDMTIDQRNVGAAVTPTPGVNTYTIDRFAGFGNQASKFTVQQNAGGIAAPAKFYYYLGATSSSAYSILAGDFFGFFQAVEGFNTLKLNWGTSDAQTVTVSFWARSSLTGTFGGSLRNRVPNRSYPFTYTIDSANTWEYKTITIPGDTTGTWAGTNLVGIYLSFGLGVGSSFSGSAGSWAAANYISASGATSVVGTSGATLYITGVQLEADTKATPFEELQYTTQLQLCQRYFEKSVAQNISITAVNKTSWIIPIYASTAVNGQNYGNRQFAVIKRAAPTISIYPYATPTNLGRVSSDGGTDFGANSGIANTAQDSGFSIANTSGGTLTTGAGQRMFIANWYATAEL